MGAQWWIALRSEKKNFAEEGAQRNRTKETFRKSCVLRLKTFLSLCSQGKREEKTTTGKKFLFHVCLWVTIKYKLIKCVLVRLGGNFEYWKAPNPFFDPRKPLRRPVKSGWQLRDSKRRDTSWKVSSGPGQSFINLRSSCSSDKPATHSSTNRWRAFSHRQVMKSMSALVITRLINLRACVTYFITQSSGIIVKALNWPL